MSPKLVQSPDQGPIKLRPRARAKVLERRSDSGLLADPQFDFYNGFGQVQNLVVLKEPRSDQTAFG